MPDNIIFYLKTVRDRETHRSDEPFSDMSELKKYNIFYPQDVHIQSQQQPFVKLNGATMLILVVLIVSVEAY